MSKKYRVTDNYDYAFIGLKVGDIVTKVDDTEEDDLYELPKNLHGKGHKYWHLQERNYFYISRYDLEEIKEIIK